MSTRKPFLFRKVVLPTWLLLATVACSGETDPTTGTAGAMPEEDVGMVQQAVYYDPDNLITPAFILPPIIPPELQKVFDIGGTAFPIISGAVSFLLGGPSLAERIDAAHASILAELEAQQLETIKAQINDELNWVSNIARQPCMTTNVALYPQYISKLSLTFEELRQIIEGPNLAQSQRLVLEMNALGQIYLAMLRAAPEIGSAANCGGSNPGEPFDEPTFTRVYREMKETNYKVIGAQVAYLAGDDFLPFFAAGTGPFTTMRKSKYYGSSLFERKNIFDLECKINNPPWQSRWSCYPSEGTCYCANHAGQRFNGLGSYACADADAPACLAQASRLIDDRFNADPLINTLRAQQEQLIGVFPDAVTDNAINAPVLPAVPIPEFREVPVAAVANPPNGFDVFYRSSTQSLVHVFNAVGNGIYSVETITTNVAGTPAAQVTPTTIEVYAKAADSKICHTRGPRNMNPFGPQWNRTCSDPGLKIFDSPATAPNTIVTDEGRTVFGNSSGSRFVGISTGPGAPATPAWPLPLPAPNSMAFSRKTPVVLGLGPFFPGAAPADEVFTIGLDGTLHIDMWFPRTNVGGEIGRVDRSQVIGAPSVVTWGDGRWDLFAAGRDKAVWHLGFDAATPNGYSGYFSLRGVVSAKPAAVAAFGAGRLDVFAIGTNGALYQAFCTAGACNGEGPHPGSAGTFSGWWYLGMTPNGIVGNPVVVTPAQGKLAIVVVDASGALYHKDFNGSQWVPASGFHPLSNLPVAMN